MVPAGAEEQLTEHLPAYMVPTVFLALQDYPVTTSGKTDRALLRKIGASLSAQQLAQAQTANQGHKRKPTTALEQKLQQLWAHVLNIESVSIGMDDSFFRLGGDSIMAMKLVGEARRQGVHLTVSDVFRYPKLKDLAGLGLGDLHAGTEEISPFSLLRAGADAMQVCEEVAASCGLNHRDVEDVYPCSPLQEGLMSLTSKSSGDYVLQRVLEIGAHVQEDAFRTAWERVVQSTPTLRTRIVLHSELGLLQAVVAGNVQWVHAESVDEYLKRDKTSSMELGQPLARYALVEEANGGRRYFVWTIHHAIYDGWSLPRIVATVGSIFSGGKIEARSQFQAFVKYLGEQDEEAQVSYWQNSLDDCQAVPFPTVPATVQHPVPDTTIEHRCQPLHNASSDTTTSTLVRTAWAITVSRFTNTDDVVFGATVTGRNAPVAGIESIVGPTIATVPLRIRIEKSQTVSALLNSVQRQGMEMIPFEQTGLQRIAKVSPDAQHACSFQTLLVVQPDNEVAEEEGVLGRWQDHLELSGFTTYALMVQCTLSTNGVLVEAKFDQRVVDKWLVAQVLEQFSFVMEQLACAKPETKIEVVDTVSPSASREVWTRNSKVPEAVEWCVHDLMGEQARERPDAPAICAWDGELTYGELDGLSTRLASHLIGLGVQAEDVVPLCFEKSLWTAVAMLAVLKAGGAFAPLDPEHPPGRNEEIFRQTGARVVLASAESSKLRAVAWAENGRAVVTVDAASIHRLPERPEADGTLPRAQPSNAAYTIFTSGSTGTPKGVVLEHRAVATSCLAHGRVLGFSPSTRALQFAAYTFDVCVTEILTTLLFGGCVCVPSESDRRDHLARAINNLHANWAFLTPSVARLLDPAKIPSVTRIALGGEQVAIGDWQRWEGGVQVLNAYGPAECCVFCCIFPGTVEFRSGLIGKAVGSLSWVVNPDDHNKLAPLGSVGELLVEGPILARGYLNDAEKTEAAFIDDPAWLVQGSAGVPGRSGRLYKTGDLVRYEPDGNLVCVGRKDSQVKLRGQRLELGEIEYHVRKCIPEAQQVAVEVVYPGGEKDKATLAAFLHMPTVKEAAEGMLSNGEQLTNGALGANDAVQVVFPTAAEAYLAEHLPAYMVPAVFFALGNYPVTTSGKTDRRRLREMGASLSLQQLMKLRTASQGRKRKPATEVERELQQLWARVLNIEPDSIGLDDSFFRLGGDSITAMMLVSNARSLGLAMTTRTIFQKKTIAQLARHVSSSESSLTRLAVEEAVNTPFGLTPIQELYLRLHCNNQPSLHQPSLDQRFLFHLRLEVPVQSLRSALRIIVQRHSMLRARFSRAVDGSWQQHISDVVDGSFTVAYLQTQDAAAADEAMLRGRDCLDIECGPQLAAVLLEGDGQQSLFLVVHHLVIDLVSWRVLLEELEGLLLGRPLPPAPTMTFQTWRALQAEHSEGLARSGQLEVAEPAASQLAYWGVRPGSIASTTTESFELDRETTAALLGSCNDALQTRPMELMIAALIHSFSVTFPDREPPPVFNEMHGREPWEDSIDLSRTVGWFTSMYPVQVSRSACRSLLDTVRETKDCVRQFKDNGRSYFASRFGSENAARAFTSAFPVELAFNYQGIFQQFERDQSLFTSSPVPDRCNVLSIADAMCISLFTVTCVIEGGCACVSFMYGRPITHEPRIRAWMAQYKAMLVEMSTLV